MIISSLAGAQASSAADQVAVSSHWHLPDAWVDMAHVQVNRVPGPLGDRMRFITNNVTVPRLNQTYLPAFMSAGEVNAMTYHLGGREAMEAMRKHGQVLDIGDTGAAVHVVTNARNAVRNRAPFGRTFSQLRRPTARWCHR